MTLTFWSKYKVFILGLLFFVATSIKELLDKVDTDWNAIGYAAGIAALSYIAKEWRGQGMSILGIVGVAADTFYHLISTNTFSWNRALLDLALAIIFFVSADPKSRGYENTQVIKQAKAEGEALMPASLTTKPKA